MIKTNVAVLKVGFLPANQSFLNNFKIALIGWKKAGLPKTPLWFGHVNRL